MSEHDATTLRNRKLLALGGVLAALLAAYLAWMLLASGGDADVVVAGAETTTPAGSEAAPAPAASAAPVELQTFEVVLSRDPFKPLRADKTAGTGAPATGGQGSNQLPLPAPADTQGPSNEATIAGHDVVLRSIAAQDGTQQAVLDVDGKPFTVGEGDSFGEGFKVVGIDPPCVKLTHDGDPFTVCEASGGAGGDTAAPAGVDVKLVELQVDGDDERAVVQVGDTSYTVGEGELFAGSFRLVAIEAPCVVLLHGDDAFKLCEGEHVSR